MYVAAVVLPSLDPGRAAVDKAPKDKDVKAGWTAFAIFLLLIARRGRARLQPGQAAAQGAGRQGGRGLRRRGRRRPTTPRPSPRTTPRPEPWRRHPRLVAGARAVDPAEASCWCCTAARPAATGSVVSPTQLSVLRMIPTARAVARGRPRPAGGLPAAQHLPRLGHRRTRRSPTATGRSTQAARAATPAAPVGLVGHSLGGRAALLAGDDPGVRSVVGAEPVALPDDDADLSGRRVLFVHGRRDRIASPDRAEAVARRLRAAHRRRVHRDPRGQARDAPPRPAFDRYAAEFTAAVLLDDPSLARGPVARVLVGRVLVDRLAVGCGSGGPVGGVVEQVRQRGDALQVGAAVEEVVHVPAVADAGVPATEVAGAGTADRRGSGTWLLSSPWLVLKV